MKMPADKRKDKSSADDALAAKKLAERKLAAKKLAEKKRLAKKQAEKNQLEDKPVKKPVVKKRTPRGATVFAEKEKTSVSEKWQGLQALVPSGAVLGLLLAVIAVAVLWLAQLIAQSPRVHLGWQVANLEIDGEFRYWQPEQIIAQLLWVKEENFLTLNVRQVQQQLESMSLVKSARVKKSWPNSLQVAIKEDIPVALWNGKYLLNPLGQELPKPKQFNSDHLPRLSGAEQQTEEVMRQYQRLQLSLSRAEEKIVRLQVTSWGHWQMTLANGWQIELGRKEIEQRINRLLKLLEILPQEQVAGVDLRYGKGAAVKWLAKAS